LNAFGLIEALAAASFSHLRSPGAVPSTDQLSSAAATARLSLPELGPLTQQAAIPTDQVAIDRLQLEDHPIQPLAAQCRLPPHQLQVEGAESDATQGSDEIELTLQHPTVPTGLPTSFASQFQFQLILVRRHGPEHGPSLVPVDQILILAGAMGAQASKQLDRFEKIGFPHPIAADHQQSRCLDRELQVAVVPEPLQLELV